MMIKRKIKCPEAGRVCRHEWTKIQLYLWRSFSASVPIPILVSFVETGIYLSHKLMFYSLLYSFVLIEKDASLSGHILPFFSPHSLLN